MFDTVSKNGPLAMTERFRRAVRNHRRASKRLTSKTRGGMRKAGGNSLFRAAGRIRAEGVELRPGLIAHTPEYIAAVLQAAALNEEGDTDAIEPATDPEALRAFTQHFLDKDPVFSNSDAGLCAIQFEAWLLDTDSPVFRQLIETVAEPGAKDFLAIFEGKIAENDWKKVEEGSAEFVKLTVLVESGQKSNHEHERSDVTIVQGLPIKEDKKKYDKDEKRKVAPNGLPTWASVGTVFAGVTGPVATNTSLAGEPKESVVEGKLTYAWKVTGYGPVIKGNKYGNREGFQTVDVLADTKADAIRKAIPLLKETRREVPHAVQFSTIRTESITESEDNKPEGENLQVLVKLVKQARQTFNELREGFRLPESNVKQALSWLAAYGYAYEDFPYYEPTAKGRTAVREASVEYDRQQEERERAEAEAKKKQLEGSHPDTCPKCKGPATFLPGVGRGVSTIRCEACNVNYRPLKGSVNEGIEEVKEPKNPFHRDLVKHYGFRPQASSAAGDTDHLYSRGDPMEKGLKHYVTVKKDASGNWGWKHAPTKSDGSFRMSKSGATAEELEQRMRGSGFVKKQQTEMTVSAGVGGFSQGHFMATPTNLSSNYGSWGIAQDPNDPTKLVFLIGGDKHKKGYRVPATLAEAEELMEAAMPTYADSLAEFDLCIEQVLKEYGADHGEELTESEYAQALECFNEIDSVSIEESERRRIAGAHAANSEGIEERVQPAYASAVVKYVRTLGPDSRAYASEDGKRLHISVGDGDWPEGPHKGTSDENIIGQVKPLVPGGVEVTVGDEWHPREMEQVQEGIAESRREMINGTRVLVNPTKEELLNLCQKQKEEDEDYVVRGLQYEGDLYFWPAVEAVHADMAKHLGVKDAMEEDCTGVRKVGGQYHIDFTYVRGDGQRILERKYGVTKQNPELKEAIDTVSQNGEGISRANVTGRFTEQRNAEIDRICRFRLLANVPLEEVLGAGPLDAHIQNLIIDHMGNHGELRSKSEIADYLQKSSFRIKQDASRHDINTAVHDLHHVGALERVGKHYRSAQGQHGKAVSAEMMKRHEAAGRIREAVSDEVDERFPGIGLHGGAMMRRMHPHPAVVARRHNRFKRPGQVAKWAGRFEGEGEPKIITVAVTKGDRTKPVAEQRQLSEHVFADFRPLPCPKETGHTSYKCGDLMGVVYTAEGVTPEELETLPMEWVPAGIVESLSGPTTVDGESLTAAQVVAELPKVVKLPRALNVTENANVYSEQFGKTTGPVFSESTFAVMTTRGGWVPKDQTTIELTHEKYPGVTVKFDDGTGKILISGAATEIQESLRNEVSALQELTEGRHSVKVSSNKSASDDGDKPEPLKKSYIQYMRRGDSFEPMGPFETADKLGRYAYKLTMGMSGPVFTRVKAQTDELYRFPNSAMETVINEVDRFWDLKPDYDKLGLMHNRGILLHGEPGMGKSAMIQQLSEVIIQRGDVVFFSKSITAVIEGLQAFRQIEPDRRVVVVLEDCDEYAEGYDARQFLQLLDGELAINDVLYIGTTNYLNRIPNRLRRPGRFDNLVYVGPPPYEGRLAYLQAKLSKADKPIEEDNEIERLAKETDGFSFGHLRELITAVYALKQPVADVLQRLKDNPSVVESIKNPGRGVHLSPGTAALTEGAEYFKDNPEAFNRVFANATALTEGSDSVSMLESVECSADEGFDAAHEPLPEPACEFRPFMIEGELCWLSVPSIIEDTEGQKHKRLTADAYHAVVGKCPDGYRFSKKGSQKAGKPTCIMTAELARKRNPIVGAIAKHGPAYLRRKLTTIPALPPGVEPRNSYVPAHRAEHPKMTPWQKALTGRKTPKYLPRSIRKVHAGTARKVGSWLKTGMFKNNGKMTLKGKFVTMFKSAAKTKWESTVAPFEETTQMLRKPHFIKAALGHVGHALVKEGKDTVSMCKTIGKAITGKPVTEVERRQAINQAVEIVKIGALGYMAGMVGQHGYHELQHAAPEMIEAMANKEWLAAMGHAAAGGVAIVKTAAELMTLASPAMVGKHPIKMLIDAPLRAATGMIFGAHYAHGIFPDPLYKNAPSLEGIDTVSTEGPADCVNCLEATPEDEEANAGNDDGDDEGSLSPEEHRQALDFFNRILNALPKLKLDDADVATSLAAQGVTPDDLAQWADDDDEDDPEDDEDEDDTDDDDEPSPNDASGKAEGVEEGDMHTPKEIDPVDEKTAAEFRKRKLKERRALAKKIVPEMNAGLSVDAIMKKLNIRYFGDYTDAVYFEINVQNGRASLKKASTAGPRHEDAYDPSVPIGDSNMTLEALAASLPPAVVSEMSISRILHHTQHDKEGYALATAERAEPKKGEKPTAEQRTREQNNVHTKMFKTFLHNNGYAFNHVKGGWVEKHKDASGKETDVPVTQKTFMIHNVNPEQAKKLAKHLHDVHQQEAVMHVSPKHGANCHYGRGGAVEHIGDSMDPDQHAKYFTEWRKRRWTYKPGDAASGEKQKTLAASVGMEEAVAAFLTRRLAEKGITPDQVAEAVSVTRREVDDLLSGETRLSIEGVEALCKIYGDDLFDGLHNPRKPAVEPEPEPEFESYLEWIPSDTQDAEDWERMLLGVHTGVDTVSK